MRTRWSVGERRHGDEAGILEGSQQAAEIARVELEPSSQPAHLASFGADLPQHTRLSERTVPGEIVVVERTDTLGDRPVEAAHLTDGRGQHSLIFVERITIGQNVPEAQVNRQSSGVLRHVTTAPDQAVLVTVGHEPCGLERQPVLRR